ncbi:MAG: C40 family peptidase [Actinomycetota bacterium]|nr:C40 family peptidase [Actinomycetota bacterium]
MHRIRNTIAMAAAALAVVITPGLAHGAPTATAEAEPMAISARRQAIVDAAHYYLQQRTPYVWSSGAEPCSVNGADCECLNRLAYRRGAGIQLPYTLYGQYDRGVRTSTPAPGDLVFFDLTHDGDVGDAHDHTGVFVGNGMMIHSSSYWGRVYKQSISSFVDYEGVRAVYVRIL